MNRVGVGIFLCYFEKNGNFWNIPRISLIFLFFLKNVLYLCSVKKVKVISIVVRITTAFSVLN